MNHFNDHLNYCNNIHDNLFVRNQVEYYKNLSEQLEVKCRRLLNEVASPFQIDSPLSSGGASDDPNTKNVSSVEQISAEEESPLAYYEPYYMYVLNWWRSHPDWRNDPILERDWIWMAQNWYRPDVGNPGGLTGRKYMEAMRNILGWWFTSSICSGGNCSKGVPYPPDWPMQPPWSPPGWPP